MNTPTARLCAFLTCTAFLASWGARAQSEAPRPIFLVTDVVVEEGVPLEPDAARDALATRFGRIKDKLDVRSLAEAKASMNNAALQQLIGAAAEVDLAAVQNYIQVDRLVFGRISMVGGVVDLQVKVFNVKEGFVEVGFARRLGKDADRAVILALLDTLSDALLAWTLDNYTDGQKSAAAQQLAQKKLTRKPPPAPPPPPPSRWSGLGVVGGIGLGLGAGAATVGTIGALDGDLSTTDVVVLGAGAGVAVIGGVLVAIDGLTE